MDIPKEEPKVFKFDLTEDKETAFGRNNPEYKELYLKILQLREEQKRVKILQLEADIEMREKKIEFRKSRAESKALVDRLRKLRREIRKAESEFEWTKAEKLQDEYDNVNELFTNQDNTTFVQHEEEIYELAKKRDRLMIRQAELRAQYVALKAKRAELRYS